MEAFHAVVQVADCDVDGLQLPAHLAEALAPEAASLLSQHRFALAPAPRSLPSPARWDAKKNDVIRRQKQLSTFITVLTPRPDGSGESSRRHPQQGRHRFKSMWCELTTAVAGGFVLHNFKPWLRRVMARVGDLVLLTRAATTGGTEHPVFLHYSQHMREVTQLLVMAACTTRPAAGSAHSRVRWPLPVELTAKVLGLADGLVGAVTCNGGLLPVLHHPATN